MLNIHNNYFSIYIFVKIRLNTYDYFRMIRFAFHVNKMYK